MGKVNEYQCGKSKGLRRQPPADTDLDVVSGRSMLCAVDAAASPQACSATMQGAAIGRELCLLRAFSKQVCDKYYRLDLTKTALARLSYVYCSLQVAKSGIKKKRQPTKL